MFRGRWVHLAALGWACWWFGWFAPTHQRGAIALPGGGESESCCAPRDCPAPGAPTDGEDDRTPTARCCAVCYLVATLDAPPMVDLSLPPLGLVAWLAPARIEQTAAVDRALPYRGRAPPWAV